MTDKDTSKTDNTNKTAAQPSSPSLLKALQNTPQLSEISESRVDVIVTVAQIEANLTDALLSILTPSMNDKEDDLFDDSRPLGSFMLKAKLAVRLSLVSPTFFKALSVLALIRNKCAHEHAKHYDVFSDVQIVDKINYLYTQLNPEFVKETQASVKERFSKICGLINAYFLIYKPNDGKTVFHDNELIFKKI